MFVSASPLGAAVEQVDAAIDALAAVDISGVCGAELGDAVIGLRRVVTRLAAAEAAVWTRFAAQADWAAEARSLGMWMRQRTHCSDAETYRRRHLADLCTAHPVMAARLAAGQVSVDHLLALGDAHAKLPTLRAQLDAVEDVIADYACSATPMELRRFLESLARSVDPDAMDSRDEREFETRARLSVVELSDGWVSVVGMLPPDLGARLLAALRAAGLNPDPAAAEEAEPRSSTDPSPADPRQDTSRAGDAAGSASQSSTPSDSADDCADDCANDCADDCAAPGQGTDDSTYDSTDASVDTNIADDTDSPADDPPVAERPQWQRNLDQLQRLMAFAESGLVQGQPLSLVRGSRPVVHVTVGLATLLAARNQAGHPPATITGPANRAPIPVSSETTRRLACDGVIRRLVLDPQGLVIDVGRAGRSIPTPLNVAVRHRDQHCRWPGCRNHIDEIHHIVHWADGGETSSSNCAGFCWFDHHQAHNGLWLLSGDANERLVLTHRDTGQQLTSRPPERAQRLVSTCLQRLGTVAGALSPFVPRRAMSAGRPREDS